MRVHALDTARVVAMALVIAAHAAIAYMVTPIGWAVQDARQTIAADLFVWVVRSMAMPLFFWLAGYFSRELYASGGARGLLRQRLLRVAIPLAIALVPCSLALDALWDWGRTVTPRLAVAGHIPALEASRLPITLGHLWFLYYLLVLSVLAVVPLRVRMPPLAAGALSIVPLLVCGELGLDTPLGFALDPAVLAYEGAFFLWGWRTTDLAPAARRSWRDLAAAAVLLGVLIPALQSGDTRPHAIIASGVFSLLLVEGTVGLCMRYGNEPRRWIRRISDASYAIYVVHLPVTVLLQIVVAGR